MIERNEKGQFKKGCHWRTPKSYYDRDTLYDLYITQKKSSSEIANMFNVTPGAIQFWLRKLDIPRRGTSEAREVKYWGVAGEANPMFGKSGELNPNYKGGIAPERQRLYSSAEWKSLKQLVIERSKGVCERCGEPSNQLNIHHVIPLEDGGEILCDKSELAALCPKCHTFVHSKRNVENEYIKHPV